MKKWAVIRSIMVDDITALPTKSLNEEAKKLIEDGYEIIDTREILISQEKEDDE